MQKYGETLRAPKRKINIVLKLELENVKKLQFF